MKVSIANFYLSNGNNPPSEVGPYDLTVNGNRSTQISEFLRAPQVRGRARQNHKNSISFKVTRQFDSADDASKFMLLHSLNIPDSGLGVFITEGTQNVTIYLGNTVFQNLRGNQIGIRTIHEYTIVGGEMTTTKPAS